VRRRFEELKALASIIPSTPCEADKIIAKIEATLHNHPEIQAEWNSYLDKLNRDLADFIIFEGNFVVLPCGILFYLNPPKKEKQP